MTFHDASGIIFELLKAYPRCCRGCHRSATRVAEPKSIIIGEHPLFCDECAPPDEWKVHDLPQAEVVRAANKYLDTHAMKTSAKLPPSSVMRETFGDNADFVEAAIAGDDKGMEDALAAKPITFVVEKGGKEVKRTTKLDEFLAAAEAASGGGTKW